MGHYKNQTIDGYRPRPAYILPIDEGKLDGNEQRKGRVWFKRNLTDQTLHAYFPDVSTAHRKSKELRQHGYIATVQYWHFGENMWIG